MRVYSADEASRLVKSSATLLIDGSGGGVNEPSLVLQALENRFLQEGVPVGLTVVHISGMGDGQGGGIDRFSHKGMVKRVIGGHWGWTQQMQELALKNEIEAYCLPQGTLSHLLREIAGKRPGVISRVGIGTFIDPRYDGGKLNSIARDDLVDLIELDGTEYLYTRAFPIDVAIIRGSRADTNGNLTMDGEGLFAETLSAAQAAKNSGGIVIAQVRELVDTGELDPRRVRVPGILIDALVVDPNQRLSFATHRDPVMEGEERAEITDLVPMASGLRKVIARRAASELRFGDIINLGFGIPDGVASVLAEEGVHEEVTFTIEQGHIGGIPVGGSDFGMCINPEASIDAGHQFDWYDGGGLDVAILSFAEIDSRGNVNVGSFAGRIPGVGGFINISQGAKRLVFVGTFDVASKSELDEQEGSLRIISTGARKFVEEVRQISFSAAEALAEKKSVLYITERGVFKLQNYGLQLFEIAPGVDLKHDILDQIDFPLAVSNDLRVMSPSFFQSKPLGLKLRERNS